MHLMNKYQDILCLDENLLIQLSLGFLYQSALQNERQTDSLYTQEDTVKIDSN